MNVRAKDNEVVLYGPLQWNGTHRSAHEGAMQVLEAGAAVDWKHTGGAGVALSPLGAGARRVPPSRDAGSLGMV